MKCQRCKEQPATVHVTDIVKGEKRERHLCDRCGAEEGVTTAKQHVPIGELIASFMMQKTGVQQLANLTCPQCKMTFVDFRNHGLLGCPADYDVFDKALTPLIERAHEGCSHHVGKVPRRLGVERQAQTDLVKLRQELAQAVNEEQYERAAQLRDRIKTMENG